MIPHIALLRAVNVGGSGRVARADLRKFFVDLGFEDAKTLLQSGNVVFTGDGRPPAGLEASLEKAGLQRLGLRTHFLVRTAREWARIVAGNPFPKKAEEDPSHLLVIALKSEAETEAVEALQALVKGPEIIRAGERRLYIAYPEGIGESKLTGAVIESRLKTRGTGRNWNTVLKLKAMAPKPSDGAVQA